MPILDRPLRTARRSLRLPEGTGILAPPDVRTKLVLSVLASFLMSCLDMAGVLALVPLMQYVGGAPRDAGALGAISRVLGEPSGGVLMAAVIGTIVGTFVVKDILAVVLRWWQMRFMAAYAAAMSIRLVRGLLSGPYHRHLAINSAEKAWISDAGVQIAYATGIGGALAVITEILSITLVIVALIVVSPWATLITVIYFGLGGWLLFRELRRRARVVGARLLDAGKTTNRVLLEAMGAAKEIKLRRAHEKFMADYASARATTARSAAAQQVIGELPKYLLEVLMVVGIGLMAALVTTTASAAQGLVILGVFIAGSTKIAPAIVRLLGAVNNVQFAHESMQVVIAELSETDDLAREQDDVIRTHRTPRGDIIATELRFSYPNSPNVQVLDDLSLTIPEGTSLALVGGSGAGKSTAVDLLLGLHRPDHGKVTVGGIDIWDNLPAWQEQLAVVPQEVFLLDDTLRRNIIFDLEFDKDRLRLAIERAQLTDLVSALEDGVDSMVGQRGMRLSGGQRQRIGMARALYRIPAVLVLDEATSALDNETEWRMSETIKGLQGTMTMVIVAHRLSTVKHCDQIAYVDDGRVVAAGTFDEVRNSNPAFANLVRLGSLSDL